MNALATLTSPAASITSAEIAQLVESRHDNVRVTIERLAERGLIALPAMQEKPTGGRPSKEYRFIGEPGKRDSIVVVAQLSPEFTARLVDRWQELEQQAALAAFHLPKTMSEALRLAADQAERIEKLEYQIAADAPKVIALERFANLEGRHNIRNTAKLLGAPERKFTQWLQMNRWCYRDSAAQLRPYSDKIQTGYLDTRPIKINRADGLHIESQTMITQKGLTRLAVLLARDGVIQKQEQMTCP